MKRLFIILVIILFSIKLFAPSNQVTYLLVTSPARPYDKLWEAVCQVESSGNPLAVNHREQAYGLAQIRLIRLKDYAKRTGIVYTLQDCFDKEISKSIFMYYVSPDFETTIKSWNAGPNWQNKELAKIYYRKVLKHLDNLN